MSLLLLFQGGAGPAPVVETPTQTQYGSGKGRFVYDRPYLSEWAEELRRAAQKKKLEEVKEIAEKIVAAVREERREEPSLPLFPVEQLATKLTRNINNQRIRLNLARALVLRAQAADRAMQDEDEAILLLMH